MSYKGTVKNGVTVAVAAWFLRMLLGVAFIAAALKVEAGVTFTNVHNFGVLSLGAYPATALVEGSDGNFYGTTARGGANFYGTVFTISPSGSMTLLYSFTDGLDGGNPDAGLVQGSDGSFYGTTSIGGTDGYGTVFKISAGGSLTPLYSFTGGPDGGEPSAGLVQGSDGNFYGTTSIGGAGLSFYGYGTVFKMSASGSLTTLYSFTGGGDGFFPGAGLVQGNDGNFYGTTEYGGTNGEGTVFKISMGGSLTPLYSFTGASDGGGPEAALVQGSDGNFYGTTYIGGTGGYGAVFKITAGGSLTPLYSFTNGADGAQPSAGLVQGSDGNFYGTARSGGTDIAHSDTTGTVFKISASGSLTPLYSFTDGADGAEPFGGLVQGSDGNFYGTTYFGGTNNSGAIFKISASGSLTPLYSFTNGTGGLFPWATLLLASDGNFYGTTQNGGGAPGLGDGTVFKMAPSGSFTQLYSFTGGNDGSIPWGSLVQAGDGNFYGTTSYGGTVGDGAIFKISPSGSFTPLYSFTNGADGAFPTAALVQGKDGNFYGTTYEGGGPADSGVVFQIAPSGLFTPLFAFSEFDGAYPRAGLVQGLDGSFYGESSDLGVGGDGSIFRISVGSATSGAVSIISNNAAFGFTNGVFGFDLAGPSGSNVVIEASTDMRTWIPLQTNLFGSGPLYFSDPQSPANRQQFYRAVLLIQP